jgi:hypothetical protein
MAGQKKAPVRKAEVIADTKSTFYKKFMPKWAKIEAVSGGEDAMKEAGDLYVPKLTGQTPQEYSKYLARGSFYNAFSRTVIGLTGAILRKEPQIKTVPKIDEILPHVTPTGESIQEVIRMVTQGVVEFGYWGILVDMPSLAPDAVTSAGNPYFALYAPGTIFNFRLRQVGSEQKVVLLCLAEVTYEPDADNPLEMIEQSKVRILSLDDSTGVDKLLVQVFREDRQGKEIKWIQEGEDIYPIIRGKNLDYIPFVFFGAVSNNPIPTVPPLMDLVNVNIKHWQVSVDFFHGLHYCAIPTPWAVGFPKDSNLYVGGQKAWISEDANAKCGYLEFTGQGLAAVSGSLTKLESQMAVLGARMLEEQKKAAEAADTVRMRYSGDNATLASIVTSVEQGIMKAIDYLAKWLAIEAQCELKLNREFVSEKLSAQDITALVGAWQASSISLDTFLYQLQVGEILPADRTIDAEKKLIKKEIDEMTPSPDTGFIPGGTGIPPQGANGATVDHIEKG